jgi:ABC-2 type transport system permease protein
MTPLLALWRKDWRALRNTRRTLRDQSVFKVGFLLCFGGGMIVGFFALFVNGFQFLDQLGGASFLITRRLFALAYFSLGLMLVLSSLVTGYSTIFRSRETTYLLTCPLDVRGLITHKFLESAGLSSWAFFFLIIPFAGAYAWHEELGVLFALWTLVFSIPFVILCCGLGTIVSLLAVRWLPRSRAFWVAAVLLTLALVGHVWVRTRPKLFDETTFVLNRLLPGLQAASYPLMPNWWTAEGIMALTKGQALRGVLLFGVLLSNTLVVGLAVQWVGQATFYAAYQRVTGAAGRNRRRPELLGWLQPALRALPADVRGMLLKDVRTFLRDPMQWSQALIFFGLLALYFASFRSFRYNRLPDTWRNLVVFLNIFSVSSVICSLASRFVYPQLSLEGHGFWVLGLAPTSMRRVLLAKFGLAVTAMTAVSAGLMTLATATLQVGPALTAISIGVAVAISVAVSALSTGLGAVFLDLRQANPVAIISGFGGTLNLVLSLGFMLAAILPFGLVWHWHVMLRIGPATFLRGNLLAAAWLVALTALTTAVPLWIGQRSLKNREY